jgi:hypothetical protein
MSRTFRCVASAAAAALALLAVPGVSGAATGDPAQGGATTSTRDYGTPTEAPGKTCPFAGQIPVSLPAVASPVGTPLPGTAGLNLAEPSVPSSIYGELCMS